MADVTNQDSFVETPIRENDAGSSTVELVTQLTEQSTRLMRDEVRLAKAELSASVKHAGIGAGMFGTAALAALYGVGVLLVAAVAALALALPLWLAALIVAVALLAIAAIAALLGKKKMAQASPVPEQAVQNIKDDVAEVKEHR